MKSILKQKNWLVVKTFIFITILIPVGIMGYEFIILGKDSVVFLRDYPSVVGLSVIIYYSVVLVTGLLWLVVQLKTLLTLKNETKKNELLHLQSQVNPHFFFNMLNNLYGMVDKDAQKSKALILKLSELMRYSIYESEKEAVLLKEEVSYLENYSDLNRIRYHKEIAVQFNVHLEDENIRIAPLLLIILFENAFKHGVEKLGEKAYVKAILKASTKCLFFEIENNFDESASLESGGLGLKNLKRRLVLAYPKRHKLEIIKSDTTYIVTLELQL